MRACWLVTGVAALGCSPPDPIDGEGPCREVGYAIARRTFECTGDADLSNDRYERFDSQLQCVEVDLSISPDGFDEGDYWHCAFAIGELACELVDEYGDEVERWLGTSDACGYVVRRKR